MKPDAHEIDPKDLLSHGGFVGSLARSLIKDGQKAEDVVQDTWLAALENSPKVGSRKALKAWLGKVARNLAFKSRRSEIRRLKRELASSLPTGYRSTAEVVEREEARRRVVEAVMRLKEPYRSAILYRYYDDLMPAEIARRLRMPVDTVKTHLQRGLKLLRGDLARAYGGNRKKWLIALAPLAGLPPKSAAGAPAAAAALLFGGLAMTMKAKIAAAACVILVGAVCSFLCIRSVQRELPPEERHRMSEEKALSGPLGDEEPLRSDSPAPLKESMKPVMAQAKTGGVPFEITVNSMADREPIPAFSITVKESASWVEVPPAADRILLEEKVESPEGRFSTSIPFRPAIDIVVLAPSFAAAIIDNQKVDPSEGATGLCVFLEPGLEVEGKVIDHEAKNPVSGARVFSMASLPHGEKTDGFDLDGVGCVTGPDGRFHLENVPDAPQDFVALHPDYAEGLLSTKPSGFLFIELVRGHRISGHMRRDDGTPCPGGLVLEADTLDPFTRRAVADSEGFYRLPPAAPGEHFLHATGPLGFDDDSFTSEFAHPIVDDRDLTVDFGPTPRDAVLEGTVRSADDRPFAEGARVIIKLQSKGKTLIRNPKLDANGLFQATKLEPGRYSVAIEHPSLGNGQVELGELEIPGPGTHRADFRLPGGEVCGRVAFQGGPIEFEDRDEVQLWTSDFAALRIVDLDAGGFFRFLGVAPGNYALIAYSKKWGDSGYHAIALKENEILSGLHILIPVKGKLLVRLESWEAIKDLQELYLTVIPIGAKESFGSSLRREDFEKGEKSAFELALEPGEYEVRFDELSLPAQRVWIVENRTTELSIDPGAGGQDLTKLEGLVQDEYGKPVAGAWILIKFKGENEHFDRYGINTGPDGRFEVLGMKPGVWSILIIDTASPGRKVPQPDLVIPPSPDPVVQKTFTLGG